MIFCFEASRPKLRALPTSAAAVSAAFEADQRQGQDFWHLSINGHGAESKLVVLPLENPNPSP